MLVVHPHFHPRRTGVTAHTEQIVESLNSLVETRAIGRTLPATLPQISLSDVWKRARDTRVVWHAHRNNELLYGLLLKLFRRKTSLVMTRHGSTEPGAFSRFLFRFADQLITLNDAGAQQVRRSSRIVQHGISLSRFKPPTSREEAWKQLKLPGKYGFGVIGRIRPEKGQGDFVAAMGPLLKDFPEWTPVLVGLAKQEHQPWLEAQKAHADQKLQVVGEISDIVPWYQGLHVVVHPSHSEAFSMVWIEAMASGACLIASALPPVKDVIEDGRTGLIYPVGDIDALRSCLKRVMQDPQFAAQLGRNAAEEARARFGVEHEAQALAEVYASVAGEPLKLPPGVVG